MTRNRPHDQRGAALILALLILLVMTILGVIAMRTSTLELIMATNTQQQVMAMANAENGLITAETNISDNFGGPYNPAWGWSGDNTDGRYRMDPDLPLDITTANSALEDANVQWDWPALGATDQGYVAVPNLMSPADESRYTIEYMGRRQDVRPGVQLNPPVYRYLYRVTARGTSGRGGTRIVQSIYEETA